MPEEIVEGSHPRKIPAVRSDRLDPVAIHQDALVRPRENKRNNQAAENSQAKPGQRPPLLPENQRKQQDQQVGFCQDHNAQQDSPLPVFSCEKTPDGK